MGSGYKSAKESQHASAWVERGLCKASLIGVQIYFRSSNMNSPISLYQGSANSPPLPSKSRTATASPNKSQYNPPSYDDDDDEYDNEPSEDGFAIRGQLVQPRTEVA